MVGWLRSILNAAGTPMIRPEPLASSFERLTFASGAPTKSMLGMLSPTLTMFAPLNFQVTFLSFNK